MATLMIKDLSVATDLTQSAMAAVRGGTNKTYTGSGTTSLYSPAYDMPKYSAAPANTYTFDASQLIGQAQNVTNNNGNCVAFASCIDSTVNPTQTAHNNINF